jgi:hypothetical protein
MTEPGSAVSAIFIETAKVEPPEMPVKMPSLRASCRAQFMPSAPAIGIS